MFNQHSFNTFILDNNVIGFLKTPIKLKSGRLSNWYINWRTVSEDVYLIDVMTDFILDFIDDRKLDADTFFGVPEGASKAAMLVQYKQAQQSPHYSAGSHVLSMGRGKAKEHGDPKDRFFLGEPRGNTVIIEDVTTTGGSLLQTIEMLQESNITITATIGLTNRMETRDDGKTMDQVLAEKKVPYFHMSNAIDLLPLAFEKNKVDKKLRDTIEKEIGIK